MKELTGRAISNGKVDIRSFSYLPFSKRTKKKYFLTVGVLEDLDSLVDIFLYLCGIFSICFFIFPPASNCYFGWKAGIFEKKSLS